MKILSILVTFFFILACSSSEQMVVKDERKKANPYDESFDPNSLNDDDIVVHKFDSSSKVNVNDNQDKSDSKSDLVFSEVKGFRVQIIATKSIETATLVEQEVKDLFESMNHKTYLIFDTPYYKLRIGDVTSSNEAEKIRDIAKDYGYREAFIVPTKVNVTIDTPQ